MKKKEIKNDYYKNYYLKNKERIRELYLKNKEKILEYQKKYREENR